MRLSRFNASLTDTPPWRFATHSVGTFQEQILLRTKKTPNNQILTFTQHFHLQDFRLPACEKNELGRGALGQDLTAASETWAYVHLCNADVPTASQVSLFQRKPLMPRVGFPLPALLHLRSGHSTRTRLPRCWRAAAPLCRIPARAGGQDGAAALLGVPRRVSLHAPPPACLQQPPWSSRSACNRSRQTQIGGGLQWKALPCAHSGSAAQPSCAGAGVTYGSAVPCLPVSLTPGLCHLWKCLSFSPVTAGGAQTCGLTVPSSLPNDLHLTIGCLKLGIIGVHRIAQTLGSWQVDGNYQLS